VPSRRCARQVLRWEESSPSCLSRLPNSPVSVQRSAFSRIFSLYSFVNLRRVGFAVTSVLGFDFDCVFFVLILLYGFLAPSLITTLGLSHSILARRVIRHMALNFLRSVKNVDGGIRSRRNAAGWDDSVRERVLCASLK